MSQLKEDIMRLAKDKEEIYYALTTGVQVTHAITEEGTIDGHPVQILGVIQRGGVYSSNPPGACFYCSGMLKLGSSKLLIEYGQRCQYAD